MKISDNEKIHSRINILLSKKKYSQLINLCKKSCEQSSFAKFALALCYEKGYGIPQNKKLAIIYYIDSAKIGCEDAIVNIYNLAIELMDPEIDLIVNNCFNEILERKSLDNSAKAQYTFGVWLRDEKIVTKNESKAFECFVKSAANGSKEATMALFECYENGIGTKVNKSEAISWLTEAAKFQVGNAEYILGQKYYLGDIVEENKEKALQLWESANECPLAILSLAKHYESLKNYERALSFYKEIASDNPEAQYKLGYIYFIGDQLNNIDSNPNLAFSWWKKASGKYSLADYFLGFCYETGIIVKQDLTLAAKHYSLGATKCSESKYKMALCYKSGIGVQQNLSYSSELFRELTREGDEDASVMYKNICYSREIFLYYKKAYEEFHNVEALRELAPCYLYGEGTNKDESLAVRYYHTLATNGDNSAMIVLGDCYLRGIGVEKNDSIANEWYKKAFAFEDYENETMVKISEETQMAERLKTIEQKLNEVDKKVDVIKNLLTKTLPDFIKEECGRINSELKYIEELESRSIEQIDRQEELIYQWITKTNEYICNNINGRMERVENELKEIFGDLWNQLDDFTRRSLKSSHLLWNQCKEYQYDYDFDFSGVCITATAALEKILGAVFMFGFQDYLSDSGISMQEWPTPLKYWDEKKHKYIMNKKFTMGNLVYIIGYINKNVNGNYVLWDIYDDPSKWNDSQRNCLNDYLTYIVNPGSKSSALRNLFTQPIYNDKTEQDNIRRFVTVAKKYTELTELSTEILHDFIQKIVVQAPDKSSGRRVVQIDIYYNFIGKINE